MTSSLKSALKATLPGFVLDAVRRWRLDRSRAADARRPIREVFSDVYARGLWDPGGRPSSGLGSTDTQTAAYVAMVRDYVRAHGVRTVLDLGCGDFRVGRQLRMPGVRYIGVDIVPAVIARNRATHADSQTEFVCADLLADELPAADLCLVRQVLQHLSNREIAVALQRVRRFPHVLVTEHHPAPGRLRAVNLDKPHGHDTRVVDGSGVSPGDPPFGCAAEVVLESPIECPLVAPGETLRTYRVR